MPGPVGYNADELRAEGKPVRKRNRYEVPQGEEISAKFPPPEMLNAVGAEKWKTKLPELVRAGILKTLDIEALLSFCIAYQNLDYWTRRLERSVRLEAEISDEEEDAADTLKSLRKEIAECTMSQTSALNSMKNFGAKLGSNPVDRPRVKREIKKENPFEKLTGKR